MTQVASSVDPNTLIEGNLIAFWSGLDVIPGATSTRDSDCLMLTSTVPHFLTNAVIGASFAEHHLEARTAEVLAHMEACGQPFLWWVGPAAPRGLGEVLVAHGLEFVGPDRGMLADLSQPLVTLKPVDDVVIQRVTDAPLLQDSMTAFKEAFEMPEEVALFFARLFRRYGFEESSPAQAFVAYHGNLPVGLSWLYLGAGTAGVYTVGVIERERRQGIGALVTQAAMQWGKAAGYSTSILQATSIGQGVYKALGYVDSCDISQYLWTPQQVKFHHAT